MRPLLRIESVPINLEFRTQRAQLRQSTEQPRANITRSRGNAFIQTTPSQFRVDTFEARASAGLRSPARVIQDAAVEGRSAAMEATRNYVEQGNAVTDSRGRGNPMVDMITSRAIRTFDTIMAFVPSVPPEISYEAGDIYFDFTRDQLDFDWSHISTRADMEFVPGELEFTVSQFPQVIIEFIGGPRYVPPSSDPDYVPIDY
ncbi:MAG: DUF6470 family protein [Oscillospiraceae bacterium]|nr:DUF6470 family protein [Oscillospiraceae bacterium]